MWEMNQPLVVDQLRFLIFRWVHIPNPVVPNPPQHPQEDARRPECAMQPFTVLSEIFSRSPHDTGTVYMEKGLINVESIKVRGRYDGIKIQQTKKGHLALPTQQRPAKNAQHVKIYPCPNVCGRPLR